MKLAILLAILSLTANIAYANDEPAIVGDDIATYCDEQAQLAGIENPDEKLAFIHKCTASFASAPGPAALQPQE